MSMYFNGKMDDVIDHKRTDKYVHEINLFSDSKLYQILKKEKLLVNSRHKSKITKTDLSISAYANDMVIEAVEDKSKKFFIGVQWHPESMIKYDIDMNEIFKTFINSCREEFF